MAPVLPQGRLPDPSPPTMGYQADGHDPYAGIYLYHPLHGVESHMGAGCIGDPARDTWDYGMPSQFGP